MLKLYLLNVKASESGKEESKIMRATIGVERLYERMTMAFVILICFTIWLSKVVDFYHP